MLRNKHLANEENFKTKEIDVGNKVPTKWWQQDGDCRKDIGEGTRLHRRFYFSFQYLASSIMLHFAGAEGFKRSLAEAA